MPPIFILLMPAAPPFIIHCSRSPAMDLLGDVGNADQLTSGTLLLARMFICLFRFYFLLLVLSGMSASSLFFTSVISSLTKISIIVCSSRGEQGPAGKGEGIASSCP